MLLIGLLNYFQIQEYLIVYIKVHSKAICMYVQNLQLMLHNVEVSR